MRVSITCVLVVGRLKNGIPESPPLGDVPGSVLSSTQKAIAGNRWRSSYAPTRFFEIGRRSVLVAGGRNKFKSKKRSSPGGRAFAFSNTFPVQNRLDRQRSHWPAFRGFCTTAVSHRKPPADFHGRRPPPPPRCNLWPPPGPFRFTRDK